MPLGENVSSALTPLNFRQAVRAVIPDDGLRLSYVQGHAEGDLLCGFAAETVKSYLSEDRRNVRFINEVVEYIRTGLPKLKVTGSEAYR